MFCGILIWNKYLPRVCSKCLILSGMSWLKYNIFSINGITNIINYLKYDRCIRDNFFLTNRKISGRNLICKHTYSMPLPLFLFKDKFMAYTLRQIYNLASTISKHNRYPMKTLWILIASIVDNCSIMIRCSPETHHSNFCR